MILFPEKCFHHSVIETVFARGEGSEETLLLSVLEGVEKIGRLFLEVCSDGMSSKRHKLEHGRF